MACQRIENVKTVLEKLATDSNNRNDAILSRINNINLRKW